MRRPVRRASHERGSGPSEAVTRAEHLPNPNGEEVDVERGEANTRVVEEPPQLSKPSSPTGGGDGVAGEGGQGALEATPTLVAASAKDDDAAVRTDEWRANRKDSFGDDGMVSRSPAYYVT